MSTTNTTSGTYNPAGMSAYNAMMPGFASTVNSYMNNPFGNPFFQTQSQLGTNQANNLGATGMYNATRNLNLSGINQNSPAALQMIQQQQMSNSANKANLGFLSPVQNVLGMQQSAMGMAGSFKPLQTGQTQSQGGLGQFAPLLGAGLSMIPGVGGLLNSFTSGGSQAANTNYYGGQGIGFAGATNPFTMPSNMNPPSVGNGYNIGGVPSYNGSNPFLS